MAEVVAETPAQQRLLDELLAWGEARPEVDDDLAAHLRSTIERGVVDIAKQVPPGERLFLSKSRIDTLACDGRFLDQQDGDFAWSVESLRGKLAHRAIELDWRSKRTVDPEAVVDEAWREFSIDTSMAEFLTGLAPIDAGRLRSEAEALTADFRDTWPQLPSAAHLKLEFPLTAQFAAGAVIVRGIPDLVIGRVRDGFARQMVIDLKTGMRKPQRDRQELRLYALLMTLKYRRPPFRWAVYYVSEGAWDVEDLHPDLLEAAARMVVHGVENLARLTLERPAEEDLRLVPGSYCRWCGREPGCPAAAAVRLAAED